MTVVNTINGRPRLDDYRDAAVLSGIVSARERHLTTNSTRLVTNVTQCNASANDAAPPLVICRVRITNNISADTPGTAHQAAAAC